MTMFKKVFGNQMAASAEIVAESAPDPVPEQAEFVRRPPRSQPLFAPVPQVLSVKEQENAARRAECEAEREERLRQETQPRKRVAALTAEPEPIVAPVVDQVIPSSAIENPVREPSPQPLAVAPSPRPGGRARTRLLGFGGADDVRSDPMAGPAATPDVRLFPTGWIVVVSGPGRGQSFPLFNGVSMIGRDEAQTIPLAFGDMTISRENHAAIAYDEEDNKFYVGHGGKSNIIRLNGRPVLSTEDLDHGDTLRIGETVLRFVALCGESFDWTADQND